MRQFLLVATAATTIFVASLGGTASARSASDTDAFHDYIVVLEDGTAPADVAREHGRKYGADVSHIYRSALKGYAASMSASAAARLAEDPRVEFVQLDKLLQATARTVPTPTPAPRR